MGRGKNKEYKKGRHSLMCGKGESIGIAGVNRSDYLIPQNPQNMKSRRRALITIRF